MLPLAGYVLQDDYMTDFYGGFNFFTGPDPTSGFVKYVDQATAKQTNLINSSSTKAVSWGVDHTNQTPNGRPSIRMESKKRYDSGLIVIDVAHMPFGCGTWPAFWTVGPNWPKMGEIDIIEGVNEQTNNGMTLHTGPGCKIGPDTSLFSGSITTKNCDVGAEDQSKNAGCSIKHPSTQSYGAGLNAAGGGVFATQWTDKAISMYFFPRNAIPKDVLGKSPDPSGWGKPAAKFQGGCDIKSMFKQQQIVFDTTFCGQWAGEKSVWNNGTCGQKAPTCEEWVQKNPEAFAEAYWTVNALKVYQDNGSASSPNAPAVPGKSSAIPGVPVPTGYPEVPTSLITSTKPGIPSVPVPTDHVEKPFPAGPPKKPAVGRMVGFEWPPHNGGSGNGANLPDAPSPTTTAAVSSPQGNSPPVETPISATPSASPVQNIAQPGEQPSPAPTPVGEDPPANPAEPVRTVYRTVTATVTASAGTGATPTPAPVPRNVRMARFFREHRQKITRHNAKL
ncbi:1,3(4)-beta-glucanase [Pyrenophora tritici-repentis Pt-1C-BFP]|uniref:endo-1,3(4)-beta-glucanase n=1 Tax=Pyrenophora tritici-repentis (strain Pt-1C-BFP) TaxID=426418 RepID=B2WDA2_PYRTR|nr:1,3(4)-beta-glucanase [Pyrenophora tritici-repentis Pt-1C-BFP]EDU50880.1 1,3(4)-beta-glucanase [Pyrenophora tritici-repentis Pt-1C-BFP]